MRLDYSGLGVIVLALSFVCVQGCAKPAVEKALNSVPQGQRVMADDGGEYWLLAEGEQPGETLREFLAEGGADRPETMMEAVGRAIRSKDASALLMCCHPVVREWESIDSVDARIQSLPITLRGYAKVKEIDVGEVEEVLTAMGLSRESFPGARWEEWGLFGHVTDALGTSGGLDVWLVCSEGKWYWFK